MEHVSHHLAQMFVPPHAPCPGHLEVWGRTVPYLQGRMEPWSVGLLAVGPRAGNMAENALGGDPMEHSVGIAQLSRAVPPEDTGKVGGGWRAPGC